MNQMVLMTTSCYKVTRSLGVRKNATPGKITPENFPRKYVPQENFPLDNCPQINYFTRFLLLLTLSYGCSFKNF